MLGRLSSARLYEDGPKQADSRTFLLFQLLILLFRGGYWDSSLHSILLYTYLQLGLRSRSCSHAQNTLSMETTLVFLPLWIVLRQ
ncbi:hypothetical protein LY78DRAFT_653341 [Colletotrichum sublineola]|nr:hypothetical protein LY78DRAFT_653341 [Colletotrichum sublineola]